MENVTLRYTDPGETMSIEKGFDSKKWDNLYVVYATFAAPKSNHKKIYSDS